MSRRTTYNPAGMASTTNRRAPQNRVEIDAGNASIEDLIDNMPHRQNK